VILVRANKKQNARERHTTMQIQTIIGENGRMPKLCRGGVCPAAVIAADGNAYLQGYELAEAEKNELAAPAGEGFVRIPLATLKKIAAQVATL
jgi:hypothetical protein